jgi:hypothetical protein
LTGNDIAPRGALFGGFDELRKAMRQHGNIDYANIWVTRKMRKSANNRDEYGLAVAYILYNRPQGSYSNYSFTLKVRQSHPAF